MTWLKKKTKNWNLSGEAGRWLQPQKQQLIVLAILLVLTSLVTSGQTVPLIYLASLGRVPTASPLIIKMMVGYVALVILGILGFYVTEILKSKISYTIHASMWRATYDHVRKQPAQFYDDAESVDVQGLMKRLCRLAGLVTMLHRRWASALNIIFSLVTLWLIGWPFSLMGALLVVLFSLWLKKPIQRIKEAARKRIDSEDYLSQYIAALLSPEGWLFSVVTDSERIIGKHFSILNAQNQEANFKEDVIRRQFMLLYQTCSGLIGVSPYLAVGCQIYFWHSLSWALPLLLAVSTQLLRLLLACNVLVDVPKEEAEVSLLLSGLRAFLKRPVQQDVVYPPSQPLQPGGDIVFKNVSFGYKGGCPILRDFNLTIPGGRHVGIVGQTGSGKTTLIKLLLRLYEVDEGGITIGGVDIREIPLETLRGWFGYCLQDPKLLPTFSVGENLGMARTGATLPEIRYAAKMACIDGTIDQMNEGYDTPYGPKFSGGEKQRLGIALSHLRPGPIRVYDEFTSAVDAFTEEKLIWGIKQIEGTLLIIGHRLNTIASLAGGPDDMIVVLGENGAILEQGTHDSLMRARGTYFNMWKAQVGGVDLSELDEK